MFKQNIIFTVQQLADYLKLNPRTVYKLAMTRKIPSFKIGNHWRFKKALVDQWICDQSISYAKVVG